MRTYTHKWWWVKINDNKIWTWIISKETNVWSSCDPCRQINSYNTIHICLINSTIPWVSPEWMKDISTKSRRNRYESFPFVQHNADHRNMSRVSAESVSLFWCSMRTDGGFSPSFNTQSHHSMDLEYTGNLSPDSTYFY